MTDGAVFDFSTTPASNTANAGINVNTGWPPSNVGSAYRLMMAQIKGALVSVACGGTADVMTATLAPVPSALVDGMEVHLRAVGANTTTTPTLNVNGLGAKTITKSGGSALVAGDIPGALAEITVRYNLANTRWELLNPDPTSVVASAGQATITAGENLADRDLIYQDIFNQRSGGATKWYKVDTDATGPVKISPRIGIALATITSGNSGLAQVRAGSVTGLSGLTNGQPVWASATAGGLTQTVPPVPSTGTQNATRLVGVATSTTSMEFSPDDDTIFVARNSALAVDGTIVVEHYTDAGARERTTFSSSVAGTGAQTAISRLTGTAGGNLVNGGGVAAAFDGTTSQAAAASALINAGDRTTGRIGKVWSSSKTITGISLVAPNDTGFNQTGGSTITFTLYGGASTVGASGTSLGSGTFSDSTGGTFSKLSGFTTTNPYICHWIDFTSSSGSTSTDNKATAEVTFYETPAVYDEPIRIGGTTIDAAATDCVAVQFSDASRANGDTKTTFVNRTNATRDIAVEVVL